MHRVVTGPAVFCLLAILLAGCDRTSPDTAQVQPKLAVAEVRLQSSNGTSGATVEPQTVDKPVVVRIRTSGKPEGETLQARLVELTTGSEVGLSSQSVDGKSDLTTLTFKPAGGTWNPGRYLLEVTLNGQLVSQQDVDIFAPNGSG